MSYECAFGDGQGGHPVNWLITRLQPAATISLCGDDFPVGIIPVLASELGVDQARLYDTIKRFVDREQAREAKQAAEAAEAMDQAERDELDPAECCDDCGANLVKGEPHATGCALAGNDEDRP